MARKTNNDNQSASQGKISFAPAASRRSKESEEAWALKVAHAKKQGLIPDQPKLRERKEKQLAQKEAIPQTLSQHDADNIINGPESEQLLQTLYKGQMNTPRFHQEELSTGDKVLRFFDLTMKYGPAQGLTRLERWKRAHMLGKEPPQQVLRILEAAQQTKEFPTRYEMSIFGDLH